MDTDELLRKLEELSEDDFQKLYDRGNEAEAVYGNCAQCIILPFVEYLGFDPLLFKAGSGLPAGIGFKGDACGAYNGGAILIGSVVGRSYDDLQGDLQAGIDKFWEASRLVREFRERFVKMYGGINCKEVQTCVYGRSFDMTDVENGYNAFLAAGGHSPEGCPAAVGNAAKMVARVLLEGLKAAKASA